MGLKNRTVLFAAAATVAAWACGGDKGTGPGGVTFPSVPQATLNQYCIRGQAVPPQTVSGALATSDCRDAPGDGYYDGFRVRVATSGAVTFTVTSNFDSWLELVRIDDLNDIAGSAVLLAFNDDQSPTNLNARITFTLEPNTEYVIFVSGFDDTELGSYSLPMTR